MINNLWTHVEWVDLWQSKSWAIKILPRTDTDMPNGALLPEYNSYQDSNTDFEAFLLQTPRDERPFLSLCLLSSRSNVASGILIAQEQFSLQTLLSDQPYPDFYTTGWSTRDLMILPIRILEKDVQDTNTQVGTIQDYLEQIENDINTATGVLGKTQLDELRYNVRMHAQLEDRQQFEESLANHLLQYFDLVESQRSSYSNRTPPTYEVSSKRRVRFQLEKSTRHKEKIELIYKKIDRLRSDVRVNLISPRDTDDCRSATRTAIFSQRLPKKMARP